MHVGANTKSTPTQEFCVRNHQQIVDIVVCLDTVVHTPRGGNTVGKLNMSKSSGHVNVLRLVHRWYAGVLLLLPISLAVDNGEFDHRGGGGSSGSPAAAAAAAGAAVDDNWWRKRPATRALMVA
jgi:hypothetical protein